MTRGTQHSEVGHGASPSQLIILRKSHHEQLLTKQNIIFLANDFDYSLQRCAGKSSEVMVCVGKQSQTCDYKEKKQINVTNDELKLLPQKIPVDH